jgi:hypothetical protein
MLYAMLIYFASQKVAGLYVFVDFFSFLGSLDRQIPCFGAIGVIDRYSHDRCRLQRSSCRLCSHYNNREVLFAEAAD